MTARPFTLPLAVALAAMAALGQSVPAQQKTPPKAKKVWTNEDLEMLRAHAAISVVGQPRALEAGKGAGQKGVAPAREKQKDPQWYRERLTPLRAELEEIDRQIQRLQNSLAHPTATEGGMVMGKVGPGLSPENQLDQLGKRRNTLQEKIGEIEDEARRNGIESGAIR